ETWRENPHRNEQATQEQSCHHCAAPPFAVRKISKRQSPTNRAEHCNRCNVRCSLRAETMLVLQISRVHILRAVRNEIHHRHEHKEIGKAPPISKKRSAVSRPIRARTTPRFRLLHSCTNKKREQRGQSTDKKERPPSPVRVNEAVRYRRQQIPQ